MLVLVGLLHVCLKWMESGLLGSNHSFVVSGVCVCVFVSVCLSVCSQGYSKILLTSWGHDTAVVSTSNLLLTVNEALTHSAVLVQV